MCRVPEPRLLFPLASSLYAKLQTPMATPAPLHSGVSDADLLSPSERKLCAKTERGKEKGNTIYTFTGGELEQLSLVNCLERNMKPNQSTIRQRVTL